MKTQSILFLLLVLFSGLGSSQAQSTSDNIMIEKFSVDRILFPYQSRFQMLPSGARVHYIDEGQGPVLLLLHGNPTWSFLYRHLIAELKNDFRVIAPDYPGFGLSTAPPNYQFSAAEHADSMRQFVEQMKLQNMTIMMQDWGGPIGFAIAEKQPGRVKAFIIGNTWAWPLERFGQKMFSTLMGGWPGQFAARCCNGVVKFFMSKGVYGELTDAELAMYLAPFENRQQRAATHIFPKQLWNAKVFLQDVYQGLEALSDRPVLITWGQQDFAFQEPERRRFEQLFPKHQTVLLDKAGHFIQEDSPEEIALAIRAWYPELDK